MADQSRPDGARAVSEQTVLVLDRVELCAQRLYEMSMHNPRWKWNDIAEEARVGYRRKAIALLEEVGRG